MRFLGGLHFQKVAALSWIIIGTGVGGVCFAEDTNLLTHKTSAFIISPLFGYAENENLTTGAKDGSPEYGLFAMYASPRFVVNNTTFSTDVNQSEVLGNISSVSLYGDPKKTLTWYLGGSYVWHKINIEAAKMKMTIDEPLGKVGVVWRIRPIHLSITPYVGYAKETVRTQSSHGNSQNRSDIAVYGISAYWHWRMLGADAKYYLSQDLDHDTLNSTFRIWATAMFSKKVGILGRFEYTEQNTTRDTSILFGPVFVF